MVSKFSSYRSPTNIVMAISQQQLKRGIIGAQFEATLAAAGTKAARARKWIKS